MNVVEAPHAAPLLDAETMQSVTLSLIPLGMTATTSYVPESLFKYLYTSSVMEQTASYLGGEPLAVSEIDNYLYHGSLLILFKLIFGETPLNNKYPLTALSTPSIRKVIVDSNFFQECKKVCALKILWILAKETGPSAAKKISFLWIKSYLDQTPLKYLIKEITEDTPPDRILFLLENSLEKLYRLKKTEATLLVDDLTSEFEELRRGEVDLKKIMDIGGDAFTFMQSLSIDSSESISLFSTRALAYTVGQIALFTRGSPLAICANLSENPTITELAFRTAGAAAACFYPGLASVLATEALVKCLAGPIAKQLNDDGKELEIAKKVIRNFRDASIEDARLIAGETLREIQAYETIFFETITASALALLGQSLHPLVTTLTSVHLIQNLESNTSLVTPSKKVDFISGLTIQIPIALVLTLLHATVFHTPLSRAFLNITALTATAPFIMNKLEETETIKEAASFVRGQIPGFQEADSLVPAEEITDTIAPLVARKVPLAAHAPSAIRTYKAARVIKSLTDHLGGVETIGACSRQAATSTMTLYGNYTTFAMTTGALGPEIGVVVLGTGIGKGLSKTTMAVSVVAGGIVYSYTQSPALTSLVVTALHTISETPFIARGGAIARDFFRRFF